MARKRKPLFGVSNYIKKKPKKRPGRHSKELININEVENPRVDKAENVFSNVQNFNTSLFSWK